jgi:hypothetical protein
MATGWQLLLRNFYVFNIDIVPELYSQNNPTAKNWLELAWWRRGLVVASLLTELWVVRSNPSRVLGGNFLRKKYLRIQGP